MIMTSSNGCSHVWLNALLPYHIRYKIISTKYLITQHLEIMAFVVVNRDPKRAILDE